MLQVGDTFVHHVSDRLWNSYSGHLNNNLTVRGIYLVGIVEPCAKIQDWSPYDSFSSDDIQALSKKCSNCPVVHISYKNLYFQLRINESGGELVCELSLSRPLLTNITVQIQAIDDTAIGEWHNKKH